jgi:hypothetical protein
MYFKVRIKTRHMIHKPVILSSLLLLSLFLFSFSNTETTTRRLPRNNIFARCLSEMKTDTGGRTVSLDSARACIDRFADVMKEHGFSDQAGQPVNIHLKTTSLITTGESFSGKNLLDWLNATEAQYAAAGKTLMVNIEMGVYDMNYLNTYQPDSALRKANNNRIAVFLIPTDASTGQPDRALQVQPMGSTGTGGTGYDLGGVQP